MRSKQQPRQSMCGVAGVQWIRQRTGKPLLDDYDRLEGWLSGVAGIKGKRLLDALGVCQMEDIECVEDLRYMHTVNKLHRIGFSDRTLEQVAKALSSVPLT